MVKTAPFAFSRAVGRADSQSAGARARARWQLQQYREVVSAAGATGVRIRNDGAP